MVTDETRDRVERLRQQADAGYPEDWRPEKAGDEIAGTFLRLTQGPTRQYGPAWIVILAEASDPPRERSIWLFHTVLLNAFKRIRPTAGEFVLIRYKGKRQPEGDGAAYDDYSVQVDRPVELADWDSLGQNDDPIASRVVYTPEERDLEAADEHARQSEAPFS